MTVLLVTYRGQADARFDRRYYVDQHLPLVRRTWAPYGLRAATALFAAVSRNRPESLAPSGGDTASHGDSLWLHPLAVLVCGPADRAGRVGSCTSS